MGSDANSLARDGFPTGPNDEQRPQQPRTPVFFSFFGRRKIFFWRKWNLLDCNIPSRRTQETSWAMISRIPPRYCLCCVFGRRFVEVLRRFRAQMVFEICASRGGAKVRCNCCENVPVWPVHGQVPVSCLCLFVQIPAITLTHTLVCPLTFDVKHPFTSTTTTTGQVWLRRNVPSAHDS